MGGCFLLSFIAYQLEWLGQGLNELVVHAHIELEQVGLPGTVGIDAVGPTYPGVISEQPFLIIHKVIRLSGRIGYHVGLAEHQKSGTGDAVFAGCRLVNNWRYWCRESRSMEFSRVNPFRMMASCGWLSCSASANIRLTSASVHR